MGLSDIPVYVDKSMQQQVSPTSVKPTVQEMPKILVNGQLIKPADLAREVQYHPKKNFSSALKSAAQTLVIQCLLKQAAADKIAAGMDEESAFAALVDDNIPEYHPDENDCRCLYEQNPGRFQQSPLMIVRHILFAADKTDMDERSQQRQIAEEVLKNLHISKKKGQTAFNYAFAEAVKLSRCPSKEDDGLLGELSSGQTVPEFERQIFALNKGFATKLIETRYGYHIVWVVEKTEGKLPPYESVKAYIANYLIARKRRQAVANYLYHLAENSHIEGFQLSLNNDNIVVNL